MKKIYILNGPNLNLLGKRETAIYGVKTFEDFLNELKKKYTSIELHYFQSNSEHELIDFLHKIGFEKDSAILFNPGAYTHQSYALGDAIAGIETPVLEIHLSNTFAREAFRKHSLISQKCVGTILGLGLKGYELGIQYFMP